jgi:hypothetical protein
MSRKAERRPGQGGARTTATSATTTIAPGSGTRAKPRPPLAPASVFGPAGRRRWWWFTFRCKTCGAHQFGRAKTLDAITGERRASCGHAVSVMIARVYGRPGTEAAA